MAPICPHMLLKALDPLLSDEGGIKRLKEVERMSSLMRKFSKKLVSRTMYCKILQATQQDLLSHFLDIDGWNTLNTWLQDAHGEENISFLLELMHLFKILPMTVDRLKMNNTAKLIKTLNKHDEPAVRTLATEIVNNWMTLIKREKPEEPKLKKKKKEKHKSEETSTKLATTKMEVENSTKMESVAAKIISSEEDDDEKKNKENDLLQPAMLLDPPAPPKKSPKPDRPKTVKTYQGKFRSTGLEEPNPLPTRPKKVVASDKPHPKPPLKRAPSLLDNLIPEKKLKPSLNMISTAKPQQPGGVKLIAPRPKPIHVLHESASFMDALTSAPAPTVRRKKKNPAAPKSPTPPPSSNVPPPKLQFYKDTLEMSEKEDSKENKEEGDCSESSNDTAAIIPAEEPKGEDQVPEEEVQKPAAIPGQPQSILSHCKRRSKKKSVQWRDDTKLVDVRYFELDENERVNVNKLHQNFVDLKMMEMKKERQAFEYAKRRQEDKMEEAIPWRTPYLITLPPPLVEIGSQSEERKIQSLHQQTTLQELYFSKDSLPDSPHEPEPEMVAPAEPKIIPLEDVANPGSVVDYSNINLNQVAPTASLPPVLSNLVNSIVRPTVPLPAIPNLLVPPPALADPYMAAPPGAIIADQNHSSKRETPPPKEKRDHRSMAPPSRPGLLDPPHPPMYDRPPPPIFHQQQQPPPTAAPEGGGTWCSLDTGPQQPLYSVHMPQSIRGGTAPRWTNNNRNQNRMRGGSQRVVCKHFKMGSCRYGAKCIFLHPGVNDPAM